MLHAKLHRSTLACLSPTTTVIQQSYIPPANHLSQPAIDRVADFHKAPSMIHKYKKCAVKAGTKRRLFGPPDEFQDHCAGHIAMFVDVNAHLFENEQELGI